MLSLRGLRYAYAGGSALGFPDLDAPAGATIVLRGPSGSGKSTLLALIAGLLTPAAGRVVAGGTDLTALSPRERDAWRGAHLGFMPQRLHLSPSLSVLDNLALPYVAAGEPVDGARVRAVLEHLGIAALAARRPQALSVGQAQRVALARALLRRPALLVADEPTANLDDVQAGRAMALLSAAAAGQGATLIVATHDTRVVAALPEAAEVRLGDPA